MAGAFEWLAGFTVTLTDVNDEVSIPVTKMLDVSGTGHAVVGCEVTSVNIPDANTVTVELITGPYPSSLSGLSDVCDSKALAGEIDTATAFTLSAYNDPATSAAKKPPQGVLGLNFKKTTGNSTCTLTLNAFAVLKRCCG